ncbi:MAG: FAD binding domain-containing protein [Clostridium sp.]|nr:FAD binding domain-containing protein [Clostridium sp.]
MNITMAKTLPGALEVSGATYFSGGTDLMPLFKNGVRDDENLVLLRNVAELKGIEDLGDRIRIGAGEILADIAENPLVKACFPALAAAAGQTASPQIRNIATIGGNVMQDRRCIYYNQSDLWRSSLTGCYKTGGNMCQQIPNSDVCRAIYYSDTATALIVYEAEAVYFEDGTEKREPVADLVSRHCERNGLSCSHHLPVLIREFILRRPPEGERSGFYKYSVRASIDFPLVNFALRFGGGRPARIAAGAVSTEPVLLPETAALLEDPALSNDRIAESCAGELKKKAKLIKEDLISPARKRDMFMLISFLLQEVRPE